MPAAPEVVPEVVLRPRKPRVWTLFVVFGVALAAGIGLSMYLPDRLVDAWERSDRTPFTPDGDPFGSGPGFSVLVNFVALDSLQLGFAAVPLLAAALSPVPWRRRLRLTRSALPRRAYAALVLGIWALGYAIWNVLQLLGLERYGVVDFFIELFGQVRGLGAGAVVLAALSIGLAPGFGEEILFRGYIQTRLTRRWGRWVGIVVAAVLFGAMHMDWVQGSYAVVLGVYLGWAAERADSIRPTILCHAALNAAAMLVTPVLLRRPPVAVSLGMILGCAVVLWLCVRYVRSCPLSLVLRGEG
jgi:membrane protease YdiL (CAAX protease family)